MDKARESIIRRGDKIKHSEVIEILQTEDATSSTYETLKEFDSTSRQTQPATVHYASYEKSKKSKQNSNSNDSSSQCFRCGQPFSKEHLKVCKAQNVHCNECGKHGHFQIVCKSLGQFPKRAQRQQNSNSTDRKQTHYVSDAPVQNATGYYNEQGNWVAEPPRPPPEIQTAHLVSVKQKVPVIQDIQDIHPEIDPELPSTQGMAESQISFRENNKTFNFSRDGSFSPFRFDFTGNFNRKAAYTAEFDQILQFFRLTGFPSISKKIRTFSNLQMFLSRASVIQQQIQKYIQR